MMCDFEHIQSMNNYFTFCLKCENSNMNIYFKKTKASIILMLNALKDQYVNMLFG